MNCILTAIQSLNCIRRHGGFQTGNCVPLPIKNYHPLLQLQAQIRLITRLCINQSGQEFGSFSKHATDWSAGRFNKTCENTVRRKVEGGVGAMLESDDTNFLKPNGQSRNLNIYDCISNHRDLKIVSINANTQTAQWSYCCSLAKIKFPPLQHQHYLFN